MKNYILIVMLAINSAYAQNMPVLTGDELRLYKAMNFSKQHKENFIAPIRNLGMVQEVVLRWSLINKCNDKIGIKKSKPSVAVSKVIDALSLDKVESYANPALNANNQLVLSTLLVNSSLTQEEKAEFIALKTKYGKELEIINFVNFLNSLKDQLTNINTGEDEYFLVARTIRYAKQLNLWQHMKPEKQQEASHLEALSIYPQEKYADDKIVAQFVNNLEDNAVTDKIIEKAISKQAYQKISESKALDKLESVVFSLAILPTPFTADKLCEKYPKLCAHKSRLEDLAQARRNFSLSDISQGININQFYNQDCSLTSRGKAIVK